MTIPILNNSSVLVVEDDTLIAYDLADVLQEAGATVFVANSVAQALAEAEAQEFSAAVLDQRMGDGDSGHLGVRLKELGVPFLIYSGAQPNLALDAPHLIKPAPPTALIEGVAALLPRIS